MIFFFSATGNCKYVADKIASITQDKVISITECVNSNDFSFAVPPKEAVGIISPTYAFGLPSIVSEFLDKIRLEMTESSYLYFTATYGTTPGQSGYFANTFMKQKGYSFDALFGVKMPDTWTPTFDLSDKEKVNRINEKAETQIDFIIENVLKRKQGDFMSRKLPLPIAKMYYNTAYPFIRQTKNFFVLDTCIGCGLCEKNCPVSAISIQDGKPIWIKQQCVTCLSCLHRCPKFAIQYGKNTSKHGQYVHSTFKE